MVTPESVHPAAWPPEQLLRECTVRRTRRSGPGGQHRNKVETGVHLTHLPSGVSVEASERRSHPENLNVAVKRLRLRLALEVRSPLATEPHAPSALWQSRCRNGRIQVATEHQDFPALLAEALDEVQGEGWDLKRASTVLGCTTSQLTRFLKQEPLAWGKYLEFRRQNAATEETREPSEDEVD